MPKIERIFDDSKERVNPHLNPFLQLSDNQVPAAQKQPAAPIANPNSLAPPVATAASGSKPPQTNMKLPAFNQISHLQQ